MSKVRIPQSLRQRLLTAANGRCAYCRSLTAITGARHVIDHIVPIAAGGQTIWGNLCVACHSCNEFKGAQTEAIDPETGVVALIFHPRQQEWQEHFAWNQDGGRIIGLTPVGRATIIALKMNHPDIVAARRLWVSAGWHPPSEQLYE
jgi:hypothetical protein